MLKLPQIKLNIKINTASPVFKSCIFAAWLIIPALITFVLWYNTETVRSRHVMDNINYIIANEGEGFILTGEIEDKSNEWERWYTTDSGEKAVMFSLIDSANASPVLCLIANDTGEIQKTIPLSTNGKRLLSRISPEEFIFQIQRVKKAWAKDNIKEEIEEEVEEQ
ncbi:MAG: hypothetical protein LBM77_02675 [Spirochaetaceae bacterium]|nr:hypothetical protein [Spirochaetaceae bacterium]